MSDVAFLLESAAEFAVKQFAPSKDDVKLLYEDRATANRLDIAAVVSPVDIEYEEIGDHKRTSKRRAFTITRAERKRIHDWRRSLFDAAEYVDRLGETPQRLDYILMESGGKQERYQIHKDTPFTEIGPTAALVRIHATLDKTVSIS